MLDEQGGVCTALLRDPPLLAEVAEAIRYDVAELFAWGHTPAFAAIQDRIAAASGDSAVMRRRLVGDLSQFESKVHAHERFRLAAAVTEHVAVVRQDVCVTVEDAAVLLAQRVGETGRPQMLKSDYSVGGFGTCMVTPDQAGTKDDARRLLAELIDDDAIYTVMPLIIEEYVVHTPGLQSQTTFNGEIDADGIVHGRGCATMDVVDTKYVGAVVGGGLDDKICRRMEEFGEAVGTLMRDAGYVGWFDIDFIRTDNDTLIPTETNARRTGPLAAISIAQNLSEHLRPPAVVRTNDRVPLPHAVPEKAMLDRFVACSRELTRGGLRFIPSIMTATAQEYPYFGFAVAGEDVGSVNAATEAFSRALQREDA
jgi:hypothetical protein